MNIINIPKIRIFHEREVLIERSRCNLRLIIKGD